MGSRSGGVGLILLYPLLMSRFFLGYPHQMCVPVDFSTRIDISAYLSVISGLIEAKKYIYIIFLASYGSGWRLGRCIRRSLSFAALRNGSVLKTKTTVFIHELAFCFLWIDCIYPQAYFVLLGTKTNSFAFLQYVSGIHRAVRWAA